MSPRSALLLSLLLLSGCPIEAVVDDDDVGDDDDFTWSDDDDGTGDDDDSVSPPAVIALLDAHLTLFEARNVPEGLEHTLTWIATVDADTDIDGIALEVAAAWAVLDHRALDALEGPIEGWAVLQGAGIEAFAAEAVAPALVDGAVIVEVAWMLDGAPATNLAVVQPSASDSGDVDAFLVAAVDSYRVMDSSGLGAFSFEDGFGNELATFDTSLGCATNQCLADASAEDSLPGCSGTVYSDEVCDEAGCSQDVAFVGSCGAATFTLGADGRLDQDAGTFGHVWFDGRVELDVACPCIGGLDQDGDGMAPDDGDCDDTDVLIFEGAPELCDGVDNDCDGALSGDELDDDGDGITECDGDCDDADAQAWPGNAEACDGADNDCIDGVPADESDGDGDGVAACEGDCDDADAANFPANPEICDGQDNDCSDGLSAEELDDDGDGVTECDDDCDDGDPGRFPGNPEICDGLDNDCDGALSGDETDNDGDGVTECDDDCDDGDPVIYFGAMELCDGLDNSCDGTVPDSEIDGDGDGVWPCAGDCDDSTAVISPDNDEACDGIDNDCTGAPGVPVLWQSGSGTLDTAATCGAGCLLGNVYVPSETVQIAGVEIFAGDIAGDAVAHVVAYRRSVPAQPWVLLSEAEVSLQPAMIWVSSLSLGGTVLAGEELLVGLAWTGTVEHQRYAPQSSPTWGAFSGLQESDPDQGLLVDPWVSSPAVIPGDALGIRLHTGVNEVDLDADGLMACEECDDDDPLRGDGFFEDCDGIDNDCDGVIPLSELDADADGARACIDCDDNDPLRSPGALEVCDTIDNNCDNVLPALEADNDGDGYLACADDCDDADPAEAPGNEELCEDGLDNDCDGTDFACLLPCYLTEDFEGGFPAGWTASSTSTYQLSGSAAHDGAIGYEDVAGNDGWFYRQDLTWGLQGDSLSLWYYAQVGRAQIGFMADAGGAVSFGLADNTNQLRWETNAGWGTQTDETAALSVASDQWYRLEVQVLDEASGQVSGRVYDSDGATLLGSLERTFGAPVLGGIAFRGFGGDLDTVTACSHFTSWQLDLTPPSGTLITDASIGWGNRGYRFVASQDFSLTGASWKANIPIDGILRLNVYNASGAFLAQGATVAGTGVDEWLRSDLSFQFVAGETYTVSFYSDQSFSGGADRQDGTIDGWAVDGVVEQVEVVARHVGNVNSNNQIEGYPSDADDVGMRVILHVGP